MNLLKSRKFRQGSFATAFTILGIVMIIVLYIMLSTISTRLNWRLDLTPERLFEITQESMDFLAALDEDVNIFVLNDEDSFINAAQPFSFQANEVIRRYESFGARINLEYVDLVRSPTFVANYSDLDLMPNQILIESRNRDRQVVIEFQDLFNIVTGQGGQTTIRSSRAEQVMTSAILNVTSDVQIKVSVLEGYNQSDISSFTQLLEMNNYEIVHENLATVEDINSEATIALLVAPARDISEDDLRKLDRFLNNNNEYGRTLFFITGAEKTPVSQKPNLSAWLAEWGIAIGDSVLFEGDMTRLFSLGDPFAGFVDYSDNERAQDFSQSLRAQELLVASYYSNPLSILFTDRNFRFVNPLLQTSEMSGILPEGELTAEDLDGPHPVLVLSNMFSFENGTQLDSYVLVSGTYTAFSSAALGEVNFANSEYFLGLMGKLANRDDMVMIQDKTFSIDTMQMTWLQARAIAVVVVIILPVVMLGSGIVIWLRRRHR
jgi:ABC-type uncharacterized transport system involved in gliding motility auxiliary subunit